MEWMIPIVAAAAVVLALWPGTLHAGGSKSSSKQVPAVGPKSDELIALENQFYQIANQTIAPYMASLDGSRPLNLSPAKQPQAYIEQRVWKDTGSESGSGRFVTEKIPVKFEGYNNYNGYNQSDTIVSNGKPAKIQGKPVPTKNGVPQPYDDNTLMGQLFNDATSKTYAANDRYNSLMSQTPDLSRQISESLLTARSAGDKYFGMADQNYADARNYLGQGERFLGDAAAAGDPWYDKASNVYAEAEKLLGVRNESLNYANEANQWYDDYARGMLGQSQDLLNTGQVPQAIMDAIEATVTSGLNKSMGTALNDMAGRGIVNSSVTNRGMADMSREAADALQAGYLNTFNTVLGGYNDSARTAAESGRAFSDTYLNAESSAADAMRDAVSLGDSYGQTGSMRTNDLLGVADRYGNYAQISNNAANSQMAAGSQRINDWLNIADGFGGALDMNLKERESLMNDISRYYMNAAAPMMPAFNVLQQMQTDHWNSNRQDTVVTQKSGGCFLTTAVCEYFGKPDDCYELTTLRRFRDEWLKKQPHGEELVKDYYKSAPRMVEQLNASPDRDAIYGELWRTYIQPCIRDIENQEYEQCRERYINMMRFLDGILVDDASSDRGK